MIKLIITSLLFILCLSGGAIAQYDSINTKIGDYTFRTKINSAEYTTQLIISKGGKTIQKMTFLDYIIDVNEYKLTPEGKKYIFIDLFSGGAHCCYSLIVGIMKDDKFLILDSAFYGNSGILVEDVNKDGTMEIISYNDMFAYAFTNYSESRFPTRIQHFKEGRLTEVTSDFKDLIRKEIAEYKSDLDAIPTDSIICPSSDSEDTFNTDAGTVKTILAAIVADYYTIGEVEKGYALVKEKYRCADRDKFIKILKEEFKLK
jgi:hypothetical protein